LNLEYDGLLSNIGFKFNLRRYTEALTAKYGTLRAALELARRS
jgi:hypothetical protein